MFISTGLSAILHPGQSTSGSQTFAVFHTFNRRLQVTISQLALYQPAKAAILPTQSLPAPQIQPVC